MKSNNDNDHLKDRIAGCLIGLIVGDALGVPHEFSSQRVNIYTGLLYIKPKFSFRSGIRIDVIAQWSDDSELTLCILRSLVKNNGKYVKDDVIKSYLNWAKSSKAMGRNTRALFKGITTVKGYQKRWDGIFKDTPDTDWTKSNGSLMRCSMLAFINDDAIVEDCCLTNPHKVNIDCNLIYCLLIKFSVTELTDPATNKEKQIDIINTILESQDIHPDVISTIRDALSDIIPTRNLMFTNGVKSKGYCLHGLYCSVQTFVHCDNYQDAIDTIIRLGGDTDTNAAIAGALLGAKFGYNKLNSEDRTSKNIALVRNANFNEGQNPRPDECCIKDFDELIDKFVSFVKL